MTVKKHLITAALPYANGAIHIGHLLEYIQADIYSRFLKIQGHDALYICASDMHGTPIEINAAKAGVAPIDFVEKYWREHQQDFASFQIQFDNYYKTHSKENKEFSEYFFAQLKKKGYIYIKSIKVVYCETCKRSLPDRYVKGTCPHCKAQDQYGDVCEKCSAVLKGVDLLNPYCVTCKSKPIHKDSKHYFFKLSSFSKDLEKWIKAAPLQTEVKNWLYEWLNKGLEDWCISRDEPYFGFEISDAKKETGEKKFFYVWLDAPIGYISSTKNYCDKHKKDWKSYWHKGHVHHFIGKDIAYFHFLFWPAMLLAVGIPLPHLTVHGFITVNGEKMSKSRGTFLTAKDFLTLYPAESLRFYYASHLDTAVVDVDLNYDELRAQTNNVLVGNLGNFCYRVLSFAAKNYSQIKKVAKEEKLEEVINEKIEKVKEAYAHLHFKEAVKIILEISDLGNAYFQQKEPWKNKEEAKDAVGFCVALARTLSILFAPILPNLSQKVWNVLNEKELEWSDISLKWSGKINTPEVFVQKIEEVKNKQTFALNLQVGLVEEVVDHPNADSLFILKVNFKHSKKQIVTSLKKHLPKSAFLHKKLIFCVNLKPSKFRSEVSEAMILAAEDDTTIVPLEMPKTEIGSTVTPSGYQASTDTITMTDFEKVELSIQKGKVVFENKALVSSSEEVVVKGVKEGSKVR